MKKSEHSVIRRFAAALICAVMLMAFPAALAQNAPIDLQQALNIAFTDAEVSPADVQALRIQPDTEDGQAVFEIEFTYGNEEFDYTISTAAGTVLKRSYEPTTARVLELSKEQHGLTPAVTAEQAQQIALNAAGLKASEVNGLSAVRESDDLMQVFEVTFRSSDTVYEYDVDCITGTICAMSMKPLGSRAFTDASSAASGLLSKDQAVSKALSDAGLKASAVTVVKSHLEKDDGIYVYDIEFVTGTAEYEYQINAATGAVLERSVDNHDRPTAVSQPSVSADYIGVDRAKQIAVSHAGRSLSGVTFTKAKLEKDDGIMQYDIEFRAGGVEYEYEIRATNGAILSRDSEKDDDRRSSGSSRTKADNRRDRDDDDDDDDDDDRRDRDDDDDDDDDD